MALFKKAKPANQPRQRLRSGAAPSNTAFSYQSRRLQEQNTGRQSRRDSHEKTGKKAHYFWKGRLGLACLLLASLAALISVISLSSTPKVLPMTTGDDQAFLHSQREYQNAAAAALRASVFNRTKLTVNSGAVTSSLERKYPELTHVSFTLPLIAHRPIVYIEAAKPIAIIDSATGTYALDNTGRALLSEDNLSDKQQGLPHIADRSGFKVQIGKQVLTAQSMSFIETLMAQLQAKQQDITEMTLPPAANELDIKLSGLAYTVKFNLHDGNARQQIGTLLAAQAKLKQMNVMPAQYIDVRLSGRAYYK